MSIVYTRMGARSSFFSQKEIDKLIKSTSLLPRISRSTQICEVRPGAELKGKAGKIIALQSHGHSLKRT